MQASLWGPWHRADLKLKPGEETATGLGLGAWKIQKLKPNAEEKNLRLSTLPTRSAPPTHASLAAGREAKELSFQCLEWAPIFLLLPPLGPVIWAITSVLKRKGTFLWRFGPQPAQFEPLPSSHPSCLGFHSCSMDTKILFLFGFWRFFPTCLASIS